MADNVAMMIAHCLNSTTSVPKRVFYVLVLENVKTEVLIGCGLAVEAKRQIKRTKASVSLRPL